jgi:hypothetical protein
VINDLEEGWSGAVDVFFESGGQKTEAFTLEASAEGYQRIIKGVNFKTPSEPGIYDLVAEIDYKGEKVRSIREISILPGSGSPGH